MLDLTDIAPGQSCRMNCPECGRRNSLSVSNEHGLILYHCFGLGCGYSGRKFTTMSAKDIKAILSRHEPSDEPFRIPEELTFDLPRSKINGMLEAYNSYTAIKDGRATIAYDKKRDRLVFINRYYQESTLCGAIGRKFHYNEYTMKEPKWYVYPNSKPLPFVILGGPILVLVEDCFSACAAARLKEITPVALLGTSFKESYVDYIKSLIKSNSIQRVIIALDRDAIKKALDMKNMLSYILGGNVEVRIVKDDYKYLSQEEIRCNVFGPQPRDG